MGRHISGHMGTGRVRVFHDGIVNSTGLGEVQAVELAWGLEGMNRKPSERHLVFTEDRDILNPFGFKLLPGNAFLVHPTLLNKSCRHND